MKLRRFAAVLVLCVLPAFAQQDEPAKPPADAGKAEAKPGEPMKNPLPADKSVPQTITVNGKTIHYTATVGTILLKDNQDKTNGVVMYTAFTVDPAEWRPRRFLRLLEPGSDWAETYRVCQSG
jgi:carboxypeptidase C (cathepsin A)